MSNQIICGECGAPMVLRQTKRFLHKNGQPRKFYGCSRWPECNGIHGAHPNGEPLGIPANKETKRWRIKAHNVFDEWWKSGSVHRKRAYQELNKHFDREIHIGAADIPLCREIIDFCLAQKVLHASYIVGGQKHRQLVAATKRWPQVSRRCKNRQKKMLKHISDIFHANKLNIVDETESGILVCGDCLEVLPLIPDGAVDAVITDPPYGINYNNTRLNRQSGSHFADIENDGGDCDLRIVLKRPELRIIFGALNFLEQLPHKGRWICWDKRTVEAADGVLGSPFELAWSSNKMGYDKIYRVMHGGVVNDDGGKRVHPTQKPVRLFRKILNDFTKPNDLILDAYVGSGSTLVAAKQLGRHYIGIEISEKYCEIAKQRLAREQLKI